MNRQVGNQGSNTTRNNSGRHSLVSIGRLIAIVVVMVWIVGAGRCGEFGRPRCQWKGKGRRRSVHFECLGVCETKRTMGSRMEQRSFDTRTVSNRDTVLYIILACSRSNVGYISFLLVGFDSSRSQ